MGDKLTDALVETLVRYHKNRDALDDDLVDTWEDLKDAAHSLVSALDDHLRKYGAKDGSDSIFHDYYKITDKLQAAQLRNGVKARKEKKS